MVRRAGTGSAWKPACWCRASREAQKHVDSVDPDSNSEMDPDPEMDPEHCSNRERVHSGVRPGKLDCKSVPAWHRRKTKREG